MPGYPPPLPPGSAIQLPGRGSTWVWDSGGDRPPAMLLHGWSSTAALNWSAAMRPLARTWRVLAPDHRGHGRGVAARRFSLEDCADDHAALIRTLGVGPVIVAGYSMGGPVGLLLWRRHPEVVAGLVLCATAARFPGRLDLAPAITAVGVGLSYLLGAIPGEWRQQALTRMVVARDPDPERARWVLGEQGRSDPALLVQAAAALNGFDATGWIDAVDVPTSVVITTRDRTVPPDRQWHLARTIPGAEHATVAAGHRACVEAADRFVPTLDGALRSVRDRSQGADRTG